MPTAKKPFDTIETFLNQVGYKAAEANTEAGSIGGATTHPVKNVDDNTEDAKEGARSSENTSDVKDDQGKPSVDSTPEKKADGETNPPANYGIGTKVAPTGEDPANETGKAKAKKDDPGSSHPARTDNDELDGFKYASVNPETDSLEKVAEAVAALGNRICASIAAGDEKTANEAAPRGRQAAPAAGSKQAAAVNSVDPAIAEQYGWGVAAMLSGSLDKQAADTLVVETLSGILKEGEDDAVRVISYLQNRAKQAEEGMPPGGGGGGQMDPAMMAAMGGGGDPAAAGGMPPGAEGGGDPAAGGGDPAAGGGEGGKPDLQQVLQALGISEEELIQAIQAEQAQGGGGGDPAAAGGDPAAGGMPPGAGGMPPGGGAPGGAPPGMEVAAGDKGGRRTTVPSKEAVANYVLETVGRSRAKKAAAAAR